MKCDVNWIPLRIRVRSRNTQPHLTVEGKELELELDLDQFQLQFFTSLVYSQPHPPRPANCTLFCLEVLFLFRSLKSLPFNNSWKSENTGGTTTTPGGANDYFPHIGVNRGSPCIWDRGTIGIGFHQSKVLSSGDLLTMTWEEVAYNKGHDHVLSDEVVKFLIFLAEQKSDVFARAPSVSILRA